MASAVARACNHYGGDQTRCPKNGGTRPPVPPVVAPLNRPEVISAAWLCHRQILADVANRFHGVDFV
jgi:hypothetical protein